MQQNYYMKLVKINESQLVISQPTTLNLIKNEFKCKTMSFVDTFWPLIFVLM